MTRSKPVEGRITATFEFSRNGYLRTIYLNVPTDRDQATLERALNRLIRPSHGSWVRRLFRRW